MWSSPDLQWSNGTGRDNASRGSPSRPARTGARLAWGRRAPSTLHPRREKEYVMNLILSSRSIKGAATRTPDGGGTGKGDGND
ncbi:hypothetical protein Slala05_82450 [Streptomyces lavendulae subsp. lavendulae]|nr:hypothetical protein Slala05_82450 [Streptomyces lavendulae subsp. lavendulae]